LKVAEPLKIGR